MTHPQLTRICSNCGIEKPLSAFLQLSGTQGTIYGNICSSCRSKGVTGKSTPTEDTEKTGPSGQRIGSKEKVYIETKQKEKRKDAKEQYRQELDKKETETKNKTNLDDVKEKEIKTHREYIESKKQNFITQTTPVTTEPEPADAKPIDTQTRTPEGIKQEEFVRRETQVATWDSNVPFADPPSAQFKYQTPAFLQFMAWMGKAPHETVLKKMNNIKTEKDTAQFKKQNVEVKHQVTNKEREVKHQTITKTQIEKNMLNKKVDNNDKKDSLDEYLDQRLKSPYKK